MMRSTTPVAGQMGNGRRLAAFPLQPSDHFQAAWGTRLWVLEILGVVF